MIVTRAPYRIPLGGGGTDLPSYYENHGGFAVSVAIDKHLYICLNRPAADDLIRLKYSIYEQVATSAEIKHDLVRPTLELLGLDRKLEIASLADVPAGTGLGSSGTYLVALLIALHEMTRNRLTTKELADLACHIEIDIAGHPVGKHDQYMAAFGGFTCLEIARDGKVDVTPLAISERDVEELRASLLVCFTGITRSSGEILGDQKAATEAGDPEVLDSLHRTKDLGYRIRESLETGELDRFGRLLDEHWQNKRRRSAKIGGGAIDRWYQVAMDNGALGGKIMGAGGGGFFLLYCPPRTRAKVRAALGEAGLTDMPFDFDLEGAKVVANF